eukprot:scaffold15415_cov63-Phaeocystis_antarctica.AAC.2
MKAQRGGAPQRAAAAADRSASGCLTSEAEGAGAASPTGSTHAPPSIAPNLDLSAVAACRRLGALTTGAVLADSDTIFGKGSKEEQSTGAQRSSRDPAACDRLITTSHTASPHHQPWSPALHQQPASSARARVHSR